MLNYIFYIYFMSQNDLNLQMTGTQEEGNSDFFIFFLMCIFDLFVFKKHVYLFLQGEPDETFRQVSALC